MQQNDSMGSLASLSREEPLSNRWSGPADVRRPISSRAAAKNQDSKLKKGRNVRKEQPAAGAAAALTPQDDDTGVQTDGGEDPAGLSLELTPLSAVVQDYGLLIRCAPTLNILNKICRSAVGISHTLVRLAH